MSETLKPCPFCGRSGHIEQRGDPRMSTIYQCDDCGCRLETGEERDYGAEWNRRTPPPSHIVVGSGDTIMKADVEKMIRDWQAECADHPALHNQGNVLLDRLKALMPSLAMDDFLTGMDSLADQALSAPEPIVVGLGRLDDATKSKLREALRFSASRSVMSSEDERRILNVMDAPQEGFALVPVKMTAAMINAWSGGLTVTTDEIALNTSFQDAWARVLRAALSAVEGSEG